LWVGHYLWERPISPTEGEQYHRFEPLVARLPIGNSFTPLMPLGWKDAGVRPAVWQFSDEGKLSPMSRNVDLNFVNRAWYEGLYGGTIPVPIPKPLVVEVRHPSGVSVVTVEV
jgi:hypothetical protein